MTALARVRERITRHATAITLGAIGIAAAAYAVLGFQRRWISDDGLIVVRVVRQILEGNGPNFNAFERAEPNTSALWQWLLAGVASVTPADIAKLAVYVGLVLAVAGFAIALDGTRRLRRTGEPQLLLPTGAFVILAVSPFWDYATSGLETGLCFAWIGVAWHQLALVERGVTPRRELAIAVVLGLGPLVRPDLALASFTFMAAAWLVTRPSWRRTLVLAAAAGALPVAYLVFRAGYYGTLVPLPALAKGATGAVWDRGILYLTDFVRPYYLWLPIAVLAVIAAVTRGGAERRVQIVMAAPVLAGIAIGVFVVRVGGDFMHARLLLPSTFLVVLPVLLLPVRKLTAPALVLLAGWALVTCGNGRDPKDPYELVSDERLEFVLATKTDNPIEAADHIRASGEGARIALQSLKEGKPELVTEGGVRTELARTRPVPIAFVVGRLGLGGAVAPLDGIVVDTLGLANPVGARLTINNPGMAGHEKVLPYPYIHADFGEPTPAPDGSPRLLVEAAKHAMSCGEFAELLASARAPLTPARFWDNLSGALRRTRLVIPADPIEAEWKFCGDAAKLPRVRTSTSYESANWSRTYLVDGLRESEWMGSMGYSSAPNHPEPQWIELEYRKPRTISNVAIYPRTDHVGLGFPVDVLVETWNGTTWVEVGRRADIARPKTPGATTIPFAAPVTTTRLRLTATKMGAVEKSYQLMLAEVEGLP